MRRSRMRRVSRKPFDVFVDDKPVDKVKSPDEFEKFLDGIDRKKHSVRLR